MFMPRITNRREIAVAYEKLGRRKGKPVTVGDMRDGDLVRVEGERPGAWNLLLVRLAKGEVELTVAHDMLFCGCYQVCRLRKESTKQFRHIAGRDEYPQPQREPEVDTEVYFNPDGTVCCQNFVHGLAGQHFTMTRSEYEAKKEAEVGKRNWLETGRACGCREAKQQPNR